MAEKKTYVYRDPSLFTQWLTALIWILIGTVAINGAALIWRYVLLSDFVAGSYSDRASWLATARLSDRLVTIMAIPTGLLGVATAIMFFSWLYRASANVHAMGAAGLNATPGFTVGMYFIPFLNLFMPPIVMSEMWRASANATQWVSQRRTPIIPIWWLLQILVGIGSIVSFLMARSSTTVDALMAVTRVQLAFFGVDILYRLSLLWLVTRISRAQVSQHDAVAETEQVFA